MRLRTRAEHRGHAGSARLVSIIATALMVAGLLAGQPVSANPATAPAAAPTAGPAPALVFQQPSTTAVDLCASDGSITMPDSTVVPVWGFVQTTTCTTGLVNDSNFPGPTIEVFAGDTVTFNLTNALAEPTSIIVPQQDVTTTGGTPGTFATEAAAGGGTATYTIAAAAAGTYLYESGTNAGIQIPMGLYGALIVEAASGQAYGPATAYDTDAVLLLSEIDVALNANPGGFDPLNYHPTYWLINGEAYPNTSPITANSGDQVLLRYLNAGFDNPSMALLGAYQEVIAKESFEFMNPISAVAEIVPAGTTADLMVDTSGLDGSLPLYNRNGYVTNGDAYPGGMLTFLDVQAPVGNVPSVSIVSPAQGATVFGDAVAIQIDAADVEDAAGSLTVEWNVDGGAWQTASWNGATYEATWDTTAVSDGVHMVNVRATDSDANVTSDSNNAIVSNQPVVTINAPADGSTIAGDVVLVQIDATDAEDAAGSLTVTWDVDGGPTQAATSTTGTIYEAVLDTTLLTEGAHTINAQATDSRANAGGDANSVTVSNVPAVTIVSPAEGSTVSGEVTIQIDATDAEDAAGSLTVIWDVNGGASATATWNGATGYYEASWNTPSPPVTVTLHAQATDSRGNVADDSNSVTVGANSIHIGDLDGTSTPGGGPNWTASVTATVHDVTESAVANATVSIDATRTAKSDGSASVTTLTCITDGAGQCTVNRTVNSNQYEDEVSFVVTDITNSAPYDSDLDHDPDVDSDGTTIVVSR